jgi:hypothetical protein
MKNSMRMIFNACQLANASVDEETNIYTVCLYRAETLDRSRSLRTSAMIRAIDASRIRKRGVQLLPRN